MCALLQFSICMFLFVQRHRSVNKVIVTASNDIRTEGLGSDVDGKCIFVHLLIVVPNLL